MWVSGVQIPSGPFLWTKMPEEKKPKNCIAVIILNGDKVLIGKRKNIRGDGLYAFPGGGLDFREKYQDCAKREVREECGNNLEVELIDDNFPFATVPNEMIENGHIVVLFVWAKYIRGKPQNMEPEKCYDWEWYSWYSLPQPLFSGIQYLVNTKRDLAREKKL